MNFRSSLFSAVVLTMFTSSVQRNESITIFVARIKEACLYRSCIWGTFDFRLWIEKQNQAWTGKLSRSIFIQIDKKTGRGAQSLNYKAGRLHKFKASEECDRKYLVKGTIFIYSLDRTRNLALQN